MSPIRTDSEVRIHWLWEWNLTTSRPLKRFPIWEVINKMWKATRSCTLRKNQHLSYANFDFSWNILYVAAYVKSRYVCICIHCEYLFQPSLPGVNGAGIQPCPRHCYWRRASTSRMLHRISRFQGSLCVCVCQCVCVSVWVFLCVSECVCVCVFVTLNQLNNA